MKDNRDLYINNEGEMVERDKETGECWILCDGRRSNHIGKVPLVELESVNR